MFQNLSMHVFPSQAKGIVSFFFLKTQKVDFTTTHFAINVVTESSFQNFVFAVLNTSKVL